LEANQFRLEIAAHCCAVEGGSYSGQVFLQHAAIECIEPRVLVLGHHISIEFSWASA